MHETAFEGGRFMAKGQTMGKVIPWPKPAAEGRRRRRYRVRPGSLAERLGRLLGVALERG